MFIRPEMDEKVVFIVLMLVCCVATQDTNSRCPAAGQFGSCQHECDDLENPCEDSNKICCFNGCGFVCSNDCGLVRCPQPVCEEGHVLYTPPGECCQQCKDCSEAICINPVCNKGEVLYTPPGECCQQCKDCRVVRCLQPLCGEGQVPYTPPGECCQQCKDCRTELCKPIICKDGYVPYTPEGQCCKQCKDCSGVKCLIPVCQNGEVLETPEGECCQQCKMPEDACPPLQPLTFGICVEECGPDRPCDPNKICCSNGCGHVCTQNCLDEKCKKKLDCKKGEEPYIPLGKCCPECGPKTDCAAVSCVTVNCCDGSREYTPEGECCPKCGPDCRKIVCPEVKCKRREELFIPEGKCCQKCRKKRGRCADVTCTKPVCEFRYTPKAECCEKCIDCTRKECKSRRCRGKKPIEYIPEGKCCPKCMKDCSEVNCKEPKCKKGETTYIPDGKCCKKCKKDCSLVDCADPICKRKYRPKGQCCKHCKEDCIHADKFCPKLKCKDTYIPEGKCCEQCGIKGCSKGAQIPELSCTGPADCPDKSSCVSGTCCKDDPESCFAEGQIYSPGENFKIDCNTCTCMNGFPACTKIHCGGCTHNGVTYPSGTNFWDKCNRCFCSNGVVGCTKIGCPDGCYRDGQYYPPDEEIGDDPCSPCWCRSDGQGGYFEVCAAQLCLPLGPTCKIRHVEGVCCPVCESCLHKGLTYKVGVNFKDGCKNCTCTMTGVYCPENNCTGKCETGIDPVIPGGCLGFAGTDCDKGLECDTSDIPDNSADYPGNCCNPPSCPNSVGYPLRNTHCIGDFECPGNMMCEFPNGENNPGFCCPDCSATLCPAVRCEGDTYYPAGQCCPTCSPVTCTIEKDEYAVGDFYYEACNKCTCESHGYFSCDTQECEYGCHQNGVHYGIGEEIDDGNPCMFCTCMYEPAGPEIRCAIHDCPRPTCSEPEFVEGQCCPQCPIEYGCHQNGVHYAIGEEIDDGDPCTLCTCFDAPAGPEINCAIYDCLHMFVNCFELKYVEGQCCPECVIVTCVNGDQKYDVGDSYFDGCNDCTCMSDGYFACTEKACVTCINGDQKYDEGDSYYDACNECTCQPDGDFACTELDCEYGCYDKGVHFAIGQDIPNNDDCLTCTCTAEDVTADPKVVCIAESCPTQACDHPEPVDGQCCSVCPEE